MTERKKVALLGGAFDPLHFGHIGIITSIYNSKLVDEIWIVPTDDARTDKTAHAPAAHRISMLEGALATLYPSSFPLFINSIQVNGELKGTGAYTIDLFDALERSYPDHDFMFVIGTDNIEAVKTWKDSDRLMNEKKFLAVTRPGTLPIAVPPHVTLVPPANGFLIDISSTRLREMVGEERLITGFVPKSVEEWIRDNRLYSRA